MNICFYFCFLSQGLSVYPWLSWNSVCRPDWLQIEIYLLRGGFKGIRHYCLALRLIFNYVSWEETLAIACDWEERWRPQLRESEATVVAVGRCLVKKLLLRTWLWPSIRWAWHRQSGASIFGGSFQFGCVCTELMWEKWWMIMGETGEIFKKEGRWRKKGIDCLSYPSAFP